jgi:hypothetical protein
MLPLPNAPCALDHWEVASRNADFAASRSMPAAILRFFFWLNRSRRVCTAVNSAGTAAASDVHWSVWLFAISAFLAAASAARPWASPRSAGPRASTAL